jgi:hypothetical protein
MVVIPGFANSVAGSGMAWMSGAGTRFMVDALSNAFSLLNTQAGWLSAGSPECETSCISSARPTFSFQS